MYTLSIEQKELLLKEISFQTSRSQGSGGQHINKVETRVELFWSPKESHVFDDKEKDRLLQQLKKKMNKQGTVFLSSQQSRSQLKNKEMAVEKFFKLIEQKLSPPKTRKATQPTTSSKEERIQEKKKISDKKKQRRSKQYED